MKPLNTIFSNTLMVSMLVVGATAAAQLISAMEDANMNDPRIWATGGRLEQVWEEALPSNNVRAKAAKEALDARLAEINRNRPEKMNQPVVH